MARRRGEHQLPKPRPFPTKRHFTEADEATLYRSHSRSLSFEVVKRLLSFLATFILSSLGWWLGAHIGIMTAAFLSLVGIAAGVYIARRLADSAGL